MSQWTMDQVSAMAPDAGSLSNGRKLAEPKKWQSLGRCANLLWGEIKGSGKDPYQTCIETSTPSFKCSCPSRKFPCKHGLGLAFVYAQNAAYFTESAPPAWVNEWQERREKRQQAQENKKSKAAEPADAVAESKRQAATEKRAAKRQHNIADGVEDLQRWLNDLLRQGLARRADDDALWRNAAARMVDTQAPGLARWLLQTAALRYQNEPWQEKMLVSLARLHLLLRAYRRRETLSTDKQADVDELMGITTPKEKLLEQAGVCDRWRILGKRSYQEDPITVQRTWLWGEQCQRFALLLDFSVAAQPLALRPPAGSAMQAELVFYPGSLPLRALIKNQQAAESAATLAPIGAHDPFSTIGDCHARYAAWLARYPWLDRMPAALKQVVPVLDEERCLLVDGDRHALPLSKHASPWTLLALSGGQALNLFGEWDGDRFLPYAAYLPKLALNLHSSTEANP